MRHLLYLLGQPGSGKSTLAALLTDGIPRAEEAKPYAHRVYMTALPPVVELGARREAFSGTDALSMSVQPRVLEHLSQHAEIQLVLGEGDRLANNKFLTQLREDGWNITLAYLRVSAALADHRRAVRAHELGTAPQSPSWVAGRVTKARNLREAWRRHVVELDADRPAVDVLAELRAVGHPVVAALDSAR